MIALRMAFAVVSFSVPAQALAGAWTLPQGSGQVIATGIYSDSDEGFDDRATSVDINDYRKAEVYVLAEYGVTDDLTLMVTPSFSHTSVQGNGDDTTGPGYTELGARYRFAKTRHGAFSFQTSLRVPGKRRQDNVAQIGATDTEIDLRALAGMNFRVANKEAFVDFQGGYRIRNGAPPNEFRLDATFGIRPAPRLLLLAQSFNTISDGSGRGIFGRHRYSNLYASGVYEVSPKWSLQLGVLATLSGRNALQERGLLSGVWFKF